jgi:hypothetical protein
MTMSLNEVIEHTANVRELLELKKHQLTRLVPDSTTALILEAQIVALDPRVAELERHCSRLQAQTTSALVPAAVAVI